MLPYHAELTVSIRVLVGIAQERARPIARTPAGWGFNPCIGRNSSGAWVSFGRGIGQVLFQSVYWSE